MVEEPGRTPVTLPYLFTATADGLLELHVTLDVYFLVPIARYKSSPVPTVRLKEVRLNFALPAAGALAAVTYTVHLAVTPLAFAEITAVPFFFAVIFPLLLTVATFLLLLVQVTFLLFPVTVAFSVRVFPL